MGKLGALIDEDLMVLVAKDTGWNGIPWATGAHWSDVPGLSHFLPAHCSALNLGSAQPAC